MRRQYEPVTYVSEDEHFNESFWSDSGRWPQDALGCTFLARAVQRLESLLYPEPLIAPLESDSDTDEAEAAEEAFEIYEAAKISRRREVASRIITACRAGTLACVTRPKLGGEFKNLEQSFWNSERCHHWFRFCDICLKAPYDIEDGADWSETKRWLFVRD